MIVEFLEFLMILTIGGIVYVGVYYINDGVYMALENALPAAFVNNYTEFINNLVWWLPAVILLVAAATFFVIELRKKNGETYYGY